MDVRAGCGILVNLGDSELSAILTNTILLAAWHLRKRCCMIAKSLIGRDGDGFVRPPDALGATAKCAAVRYIISRDEIVHPTYLIYMVSLAHGTPLRDDGALSALDRTTHIGFQLGTLHLPIAMDGINLTIIIEEHREVIDTSLHVMVLPRAADILSGVALQPLTIDIGKHIKLAVGITDGRCPNTLTVDFFVVFE